MMKTVKQQRGKELVLLKEKHRYNIMNSQTSKERLEWKTKNNLPGLFYVTIIHTFPISN